MIRDTATGFSTGDHYDLVDQLQNMYVCIVRPCDEELS